MVVMEVVQKVVGPAMRSAGVALESAGRALGAQVSEPAYIASRPMVSDDLMVDAQIHIQQQAKNDQDKELMDVTRFTAPNASVSGDAKLMEGGSVWYHASVVGAVSIGAGASIGEHAVVEGKTTLGSSAIVYPHSKIGSGTTIGERSVIGAGATVESNVTVENDAMVAQGAHVPSGSKIKSGEVWAGSPAVCVRNLESSEMSSIAETAHSIATLSTFHAKECSKDPIAVFLERKAHEDRTEWSEDILEDAQGAWHVYANIEKTDVPNPERRGLIYDRKA